MNTIQLETVRKWHAVATLPRFWKIPTSANGLFESATLLVVDPTPPDFTQVRRILSLCSWYTFFKYSTCSNIKIEFSESDAGSCLAFKICYLSNWMCNERTLTQLHHRHRPGQISLVGEEVRGLFGNGPSACSLTYRDKEKNWLNYKYIESKFIKIQLNVYINTYNLRSWRRIHFTYVRINHAV